MYGIWCIYGKIFSGADLYSLSFYFFLLSIRPIFIDLKRKKACKVTSQ